MAVYGVPRLHEDDAVRAVRAAAELEELAGSRLRIGIGTGEVLAEQAPGGMPDVAGDAVNTAKRLEELAQPGEVLLDEGRTAGARLRGDGERGGVAGDGAAEGRARRGRAVPRAGLPSGRPHAAAGWARPHLHRGGGRPHVPPRDDPRHRRRGQVAARGRVRRPGLATARPSCAAAACHTARASRSGRSPRSFATSLRLRHTGRGRPEGGHDRDRPLRRARHGPVAGRDQREDLLGAPAGCSRPSRATGRSWSSWTTSNGPSPPSSTSWSTWRTSRATRRSCSCAWRVPSCSTAAPAGAAAS